MAQNNKRYNGGWTDYGCSLIFYSIYALIPMCIWGPSLCSGPSTNSTGNPQKPSTTYQNSRIEESPIESIEKELSEEDEQYLNNSLKTGDTPYTEYYGENYQCPYYQCSSIKVTAPYESDIVVIIKKNNNHGKVIQHGYIRAGRSYQFDIPDGTYQTFFYYGKGWNPNKEMLGGVKGGFVKDEIFSKDTPQKIDNEIITYVLQLQQDGNFHTEGSNKQEIF